MKFSICRSDVLPSHIFKDVFSALRPVVTAIVNRSFVNGVVPTKFKHATVQPLLKKTHLDQHDLNNYITNSKMSYFQSLGKSC